MMRKNPRIDPKTAPVWSNTINQPFSRRSITSIFFILIAFISLGIFVFNWFLSPPQQEPQYTDKQGQVMAGQAPGNEYPKDTVRSGTYNFFYSMFGGIEEGLEDNPHNLDNVEQLDDFNLNTDNLVADSTVIPTIIQGSVTAQVNTDDGYRHSVYDIISSEVKSVKGDYAGSVHDILIHKVTGKARTIIVNNDGSYYDRDLTLLEFKSILKQDATGEIKTTITEDSIEEKPEFNYNILIDRDYISLRHLRDGQVLDDRGNVAGHIGAIIYENAEAQRIFFNIKPALTPSGRAKTYSLPYEAVNIVKNPDGYDIKLTIEQTEALAEALYE